MLREIRQRFAVTYSFPVLFTHGVFRSENPVIRDLLAGAGRPGKAHRVLPVIDGNVVAADPTLPARIAEYAAAHADVLQLIARPLLVRGGEVCKSNPIEVDQLLELVEVHRIDRQSFVLAIGGGAVLDVVGYAAAIAHRGVRLIRLPTTVLAQDDAGVGVKNGINAFGRKNFIGTFAPPFAVVNDFDFLKTLSPRDMRAGMAEAVKVAAIKDAEFLHSMHAERHAIGALSPAALERLIIRCAKLHIEHIASTDPFELGSARPLDYGHWIAHKLEEMTGGALRHGEAVAIGCALDALYATRTGLLSELELALLLQTLEDMGLPLYHPALDELEVPLALEQFREHLGGELCITLPAGLGRKIEVHEVDAVLVRRCVASLAERAGRRAEIKTDRRSNERDLPAVGARGA